MLPKSHEKISIYSRHIYNLHGEVASKMNIILQQKSTSSIKLYPVGFTHAGSRSATETLKSRCPGLDAPSSVAVAAARADAENVPDSVSAWICGVRRWTYRSCCALSALSGETWTLRKARCNVLSAQFQTSLRLCGADGDLNKTYRLHVAAMPRGQSSSCFHRPGVWRE